MFKKEEKNGKALLAPRSGLFVVNTVDDIRIELNALEPGWEIKESNVKVRKFVLLSYDTKSGRLNIPGGLVSSLFYRDPIFVQM